MSLCWMPRQVPRKGAFATDFAGLGAREAALILLNTAVAVHFRQPGVPIGRPIDVLGQE